MATRQNKKHRAKQVKAGRMMLLYLSEAAEAARRHVDRGVAGVADEAGVSTGPIYRFERGESWPQDVDAVVSAYAKIGKLDGPLVLWQRALDLWREHGEMPLVGRRDGRAALSPEESFRRRIAAAANRQARGEDPAAKPAASTSRAPRQAKK